MERELVAKIESRGVDADAGSILVYRVGNEVSVVATGASVSPHYLHNSPIVLDRNSPT